MNLKTLIKYSSIALVLGPLCRAYLFPGTQVGLSTALLAFNVLLLLINIKKIKLSFPPYLLIFILYTLTLPVLNSIRHGYSFSSTYVTLLLFFSNIWFYINFADLRIIKRWYRTISYIAIIVLVTQEIMFAIVGYRFSALIPFLPSCYSVIGVSADTFIQNQISATRSSSLFLEPSHLAQYLAGYLALCLGTNHFERNVFNKDTVIVSFAILLTQSGAGILCMGLLWLVFLLFNSNISKTKRSRIAILSCICILLIGYFNFSIGQTNAGIMKRVEELSVNNAENTKFYSSGAIRIYLGYFVFDYMNTFDKFIGVGPGSVMNIANITPFYKVFESAGFNNIQMLLIGCGYLGTFLFFLFYYKLITKCNFTGKLVLLCFLTISFVESSFLENFSLLFIVIGFKCTKKYSKRYQVISKKSLLSNRIDDAKDIIYR